MHDRHGGSADARYQLAVLRQHLHAYAAGTQHFDALMDLQRRCQLETTLVHQISAQGTRGRASSWVFAYLHHPAGIRRIAAREGEAVNDSSRIANKLPKGRRIHFYALQECAPPKRNLKTENAGGDVFEGQGGVDVTRAEAKSAGEGAAIDACRAELSGLLRHGYANRATFVLDTQGKVVDKFESANLGTPRERAEYEPGDGQGFALSTCLFDPIVGPARRISAIPHLRWTRVAQYGKWRGTLAIDDDYIDYPMPGG